MTLIVGQGVILVLSRWLRFFSGENLLYQSCITTALREEIITKGMNKEIMFRSVFKIPFVRIHSLDLKLETKCTLVLTLAGSTGTIGPLCQFPSLDTIKSSYFPSGFFISKVCGLRFYLFS